MATIISDVQKSSTFGTENRYAVLLVVQDATKQAGRFASASMNGDAKRATYPVDLCALDATFKALPDATKPTQAEAVFNKVKTEILAQPKDDDMLFYSVSVSELGIEGCTKLQDAKHPDYQPIEELSRASYDTNRDNIVARVKASILRQLEKGALVKL